VTDLRPGAVVPGAGTVIGPGPDPGTSWAVPDDPALAGVVVDHDTHGHQFLTRAEQAARMARAELILARGVVLASHLLQGNAFLNEVRVQLAGCTELADESAHPLDGLMWPAVQRSDVALAALRGEAFIRPGAGFDRRPAAWCPTCLGTATPREDSDT
jgi:hypothetical protein